MGEYPLYIIVRVFAFFVNMLPVRFALWLGRMLGLIYYFLDSKHRNRVYTNLRIAFDKEKTHIEIKKLTRESFENIGMNLIEILMLPKIDAKYIEKYIRVENEEYIKGALDKKKGLIFIATHLGNWEVANITCAFLCNSKSYTYKVLVKDQKFKLLDNLLNTYRRQKGCGTIPVGMATREIIKNIRSGQIVSVVMDQGKEDDSIQFKFLSSTMPLSTGAMRMALKLDSEVLFAFIVREKGPYHKARVERIALTKTGDLEADINSNLAQASKIFENYVRNYPSQYLWFYKMWKYSDTRKALILSDFKAGHLRQSQAVVKNLAELLGNDGKKLEVSTIEVRFKNRLMKAFIIFCGFFAHKRNCRSCLGCLKAALDSDSFEKISKSGADFVVSAGASLSALNYILANENLAKNISIMKPGTLSTKRFSLVIAPRHDSLPMRKNVFITEGAPNLVCDSYLKASQEGLISSGFLNSQGASKYLGLLIGGDTKLYSMTQENILSVINSVKSACEEFNFGILATTSRRTSRQIENLIKNELSGYINNKMLVIANQANTPYAVAGILGLSDIVIVSGESISMVSEAASSGKCVIVFNLEKKKTKSKSRHEIFLDNLNKKGYIHLFGPKELGGGLKDIINRKPKINTLNDNIVIKEALKTIL